MSEIKVDTLTGKTSAGSITVTSEGGAATQSLQQGLIKVWANFNGAGTVAVRDSLNLSSITDNDIGYYSLSWSNNFGNDDYSSAGAAGQNSLALINLSNPIDTVAQSTSASPFNTTYVNGTTYDSNQVTVQVAGDLA